MIPSLDTATSFLPLGRYFCTLEELEERYVKHQEFGSSTTRQAIFKDFLVAGDMLEDISDTLIEAVWVGGSFVTGKIDPDDIDCTFVINGPAFRALPSNSKRARVMKFNQKDWLRSKTGLRVESFVLVREPIANPWGSGAVNPDAADYLSVRGAWDDWWLRVRKSIDKSHAPVIEDAEPKRGYLEVDWNEI